MKRAGAVVQTARAGIVLAHGRGGYADDILRVFQQLGLGDVAVIAPQAPGNSWWPTSFLAPTALLQPHLEASLATMNAAISTLMADGLPAAQIWLGGFSQGACLALETFARHKSGLAGVFGLSGGLIGTADAGDEPQADLYGNLTKAFDYPARPSGGRVWLSVHASDPHIPLRRVEDSAFVLEKLGADVQVQIYPGAGHAVLRDDITTMRDWLTSAQR
jgi:phospholipase/carboxylesterase